MEQPGYTPPEALVEPVLRLGKLVEALANVKRATLLSDLREETDTDHTVMLCVIACSLAQAYEPRLDIGLVAQYAIVHDMVEAYAGDTSTLLASPLELSDKRIRETAALKRIEEEHGETMPWLHTSIKKYEAQTEPEACFVKFIDKIMPAITHLMNNGEVLRQNGIDTAEQVDANVVPLFERMQPYREENEFAWRLLEAFIEEVKRLFDD